MAAHISDVPCRVQPLASWWDRAEVDRIAGDIDPVEDHRQTVIAASHDGEWLAQVRCFDCRVAYYADGEWDIAEQKFCPICAGSRLSVCTFPMSRRAEKFFERGLEPTPFGTVQIDGTKPDQ